MWCSRKRPDKSISGLKIALKRMHDHCERNSERTDIVRPVAEGFRLPAPGEFAAGRSVNDQSGVGSTRAAVYGRTRSTVDWILSGDRSDRGGNGFSLRNVTGVRVSVDHELSDHTVSVHKWKEG